VVDIIGDISTGVVPLPVIVARIGDEVVLPSYIIMLSFDCETNVPESTTKEFADEGKIVNDELQLFE
jgi:hypothetical protein